MLVAAREGHSGSGNLRKVLISEKICDAFLRTDLSLIS
jgi:hypothetical protein